MLDKLFPSRRCCRTGSTPSHGRTSCSGLDCVTQLGPLNGFMDLLPTKLRVIKLFCLLVWSEPSGDSDQSWVFFYLTEPEVVFPYILHRRVFSHFFFLDISLNILLDRQLQAKNSLAERGWKKSCQNEKLQTLLMLRALHFTETEGLTWIHEGESPNNIYRIK